MKIISLSSNKAGYACAVATSIKKYMQHVECPTQFFDYLVCNLQDIYSILNTTNINSILESLEITPYNEKSVVNFKKMQNLISYHDLKNPYTLHDYINFTEKYKRRFERIINVIKNEDIIFFIRYGEENNEYFDKIIEKTREFNVDIITYIINVFYDKENKYPKNNSNNNIIYINFYLFENKNINYHEDEYYRTLQYKWSIIFDVIEKYTKKIVQNKK